MNLSANLDGLEDAIKAMAAAFPAEPKKQKQIVNTALRVSAQKHMLPRAKQMAKVGDSSGALSQSLAVRSQSAKKLRSKGIPAGVEIVPVRNDRKALALYIAHYYTAEGRIAPASIITSGIRHGHLIEFGSANNNAQPYLWPAAQGGKAGFVQDVGKEMSKATERAVNRARKK